MSALHPSLGVTRAINRNSSQFLVQRFTSPHVNCTAVRNQISPIYRPAWTKISKRTAAPSRVVTCSISRHSPPAVIAASQEASMLPDSREESISQACAAISANLPSQKGAKGKKKQAPSQSVPGFAGAGIKLSVEIPVADESEAAALQLASELISGLPSPWPTQFTVVSAFPGASSCPRQLTPSIKVVSLDSCLDEASESLLSSCIIIIGPKTSQLGDIEWLLSQWRGAVTILLNAEWSAVGGEEDAGVDPEYTAFVKSFNAVYCFMPLLIKAFVVSQQEGAVFRFATGGGTSGGSGSRSTSSGFQSSSSAVSQDTSNAGNNINNSTGPNPWRIFMRKGNTWEAVARMQHRPSSTDVEVSFYNASAASSPLTQGAKFLKGLVDKKKKK